MSKKILYLLTACVVLSFASMAPAPTWNGSFDSEWNNVSNWNGGIPAGTATTDSEALINNNTVPYFYVLTIHAGDVAVPGRMTVRVGDLIQTGGTCIVPYNTGRLTVGWEGLGTLDISGGTISGNYALHAARASGGSAVINVSGTGKVLIYPNPSSGTHEVARLANEIAGTSATLNVTGGTFRTEIGLEGGYGAATVATINIDGGMVDVAVGTHPGNETAHSMTFGRTGGQGNIYLDSGTLYVSGTLTLATGAGSLSTLEITGGLIDAGECRLGTAGSGTSEATITMTGGTFKSRTSWFGVGHDGGTGTFTVNNGIVDINGAMWIGASYSGTAAGTDGVLGVSGTAQISCRELDIGLRGAGPGVTGTVNMDGGKITVGSGGINIGIGTNGVGTLNMTSGTISSATGNLSLGANWGAGAGNGTIYFDGGTIEANDISVNSVIEFGTTSGRLILKGDDRAVVNGLIGAGKITQTVSPRGAVVAEYNAGTDKTTVYVPPVILTQAWNPSPGQGAVIGALTVTLQWSPGDGATSHDVYFGDSYADVDAGTGGTFKGNQPGADLDYGPITLSTLAKTYYWRIDERAPAVTKGKVWSFTTPPNRCMDTFESYADTPALQAVWGANGALETTIAHSGKSMNIAFSGSAKAVSRTISDSDWTNGGVKSISVWFRGDANVASISVKLESNGGAQSGTLTNTSAKNENGLVVDVNMVKTTVWHEMNFNLASFGVVLTNVTKITITVTPVSGSGNVYIDDICLYPKRQLGPNPSMDFNDDGIVNFGDLDIFADDWLDTNWFPGY